MGRLLHSVNTECLAISGSMLLKAFQLLNYGNVELISKSIFLLVKKMWVSQGNQSSTTPTALPPQANTSSPPVQLHTVPCESIRPP